MKKGSKDFFLFHDMILPISAKRLFEIMRNPLNWSIVNFPIIRRVDILSHNKEVVRFNLQEKILGKYYTSTIEMEVSEKEIRYNHVTPSFPFVKSMSSTWIFKDSFIEQSHFYIIRQFQVKNKLIKLLFPVLRLIINKHVNNYYMQLIELTKHVSIISKLL